MSYSCPSHLKPGFWDIFTGDIHNCAGSTYDVFTLILWALFACILLFIGLALWPRKKGSDEE